MKMKQEDFDRLKKLIESCIPDDKILILKNEYETGNFPRSERTKDLQRRFCFDVFYLAGSQTDKVSSLIFDLYKYLNDDHIYTALKAILPKVEMKYKRG